MDKQKSVVTRRGGAGWPLVLALIVGLATAMAARAQNPNAPTSGNRSQQDQQNATQTGDVQPNPSGAQTDGSQSGQMGGTRASEENQGQSSGAAMGGTRGSSMSQPGQTPGSSQEQSDQATQEQQQGGQSGMQPDNTGKNKADQPTAEDQSNSQKDREMTANIRRELMKSDDLSMTAKNVKIITENGKVILRGPVNSEKEKAAIAAMAEKVAGKGNVTDQIETKNR